ncbi:MAG: FAD-dependent monooxygenase [Sphingobacterium sp.]
METTNIAIIGGGVAGLTAAIALQKAGLSATVYEQAAALRGIGAGFGLAANAMHALDILGLRQGVEKIGHFLPSYNILDANGKILISPKTEQIGTYYKQKNFALHRGELHSFLLAQLPEGHVRLGKQAISFTQNQGRVTINFSDGSSVHAHGLIVADGIRSTLRQQLLPKAKPRYAGYMCWRAVIDNQHIDLTSSYETWGSNGRFGMTPLVDQKIYWYACINGKVNDPILRKFTIDDLRKRFANYHQPIGSVLSSTSNEQLICSEIMDIKPLKSLAYGKILLIGDAGHATTPNMGQGACQAVEDVAVLYDELQESSDISEVFRNVSERRLERTSYITNTSRRIGWIAQWENKASIQLRNSLMRIMPERMKQQQLQRLLTENFLSKK